MYTLTQSVVESKQKQLILEVFDSLQEIPNIHDVFVNKTDLNPSHLCSFAIHLEKLCKLR